MERVDLGEVKHTVTRWWVRGARGDLDHGVLALGELACGRWFIAKAERGTNMAWIAGDERTASLAVERWVARRGGHRAWTELEKPTAT